MSSITYPTGRTLEYARPECACTLTGISTTYNGQTVILMNNLSYRPFGIAHAMETGAGDSVDNRFDLAGRLTTPTRGNNEERSYAYDANGSLTSVNAPNVILYDKTLTYDTLNRVIQAKSIYGVFDYTYDDAGNRLTKETDNQTVTYSYYPGANRLHQISGAGTVSYSYDANGNITGIGGKTLIYSQNNRLIRWNRGEDISGQYEYNGLGQRVIKEVDGVTTVFHYDLDGNIIAESDLDGTFTREYLYMGKIRMAMVDAGTGEIYYFLNDRLGSPLIMTDDEGNVVWEGMYKPFGEVEVNPKSSITNNFRFPGQYYDQETGLHYNYHGYYDPGTGRYLRADPIGLARGINPYWYVKNNPINSVDLFGLFNPIKGISAIGNVFLSAWTASSGSVKYGIAASLLPASGTVVGGIPSIALAAWGTWNFKSSMAAWDRAVTQWKEALSEDFAEARWKNLYGLLPGGTEYDDPCESSGPIDYIRSKDWFKFLSEAGYF